MLLIMWETQASITYYSGYCDMTIVVGGKAF